MQMAIERHTCSNVANEQIQLLLEKSGGTVSQDIVDVQETHIRGVMQTQIVEDIIGTHLRLQL